MKTTCTWFASDAARLLMDGEDARFLSELRGLLIDSQREVPEEAVLHERVLGKAASVLPELVRELKLADDCLDQAERVAVANGFPPVDALLNCVGTAGDERELREQAVLTQQLQQLGPTLYWSLLRDVFGDQQQLEFDVRWAWFSRYAAAGSRGEFFAAHDPELRDLLQLEGGNLVSTVEGRINRRKARTDARDGVVVRPTTSAADLIAGFAAFLLDHLAQNLPPESWMGDLFVLSERTGKQATCWAGGERYLLSSVAAKLLIELGDTRRVDGDDRHLKQLEEQLPPISGRIRHASIQRDHQTTIRGVGLVGRVVDLVSPKA